MSDPKEPQEVSQHPDTFRPFGWLIFGVWLVGLWAGFLNLINYHGYPLLRPECALVLLGLAAIAGLMVSARVAVGKLVGSVLTGLFLAMVIDLSTSIDLGWFFAIWGVLALIAWFAENILLKLSMAAFGAVVLSQLLALTVGIGAPERLANSAQRLQDPDRPAADRPAIVHLILDSYLGIDAMGLGPEHYARLGETQVNFFTERGFQLYPGAYSRHVKTVNSVPAMLSYGRAQFATTGVNVQYVVADELAYFRDLDARGYRTSVVQPTFIDLCVNQPLTSCRKFERSGLPSMLDSELSAFERATVMGFTLLELTGLPSRLAEALQSKSNDWFGTSGRHPNNRAKLMPLASVREFDRFNEQLASLRRGEARIAHLLLPHDPYILDAECRIRPEIEWLDEHGPASPRSREIAYAEQVRCVQEKIGMMLDALDRTDAGRGAIVLIHGDHGSRISPIVPFIGGPDLSEREILMSHSALFAIRVPGEVAREVSGTFALEQLLADFRARDFRSAPRPEQDEPTVFIMDANFVPREQRPLPDFDRTLNHF